MFVACGVLDGNKKDSKSGNSEGEQYIDGELSDWEYSEIDGGIVINKYVGSASSVTIPSKINSKSVIKIASYAFATWNSKTVTSVTIPASVAILEGNAFVSSNINSLDFKDKNNWIMELGSARLVVKSSDLSTSSQAATYYFSDNHCGHYWTKGA